MTLLSGTENPFELSKASNFSDSEILDYWVDIMEDRGGLTSVLQPRLITPMLLLGGKGSGKTHLLRYCSAPVQAARHQGNLAYALQKEGYVGIYVPAEGLNTHKFARKGQDNQVWADVFAMYFELWLATSLLETISTFLKNEFDTSIELSLVKSITKLFDVDVADEMTTLDGAIAYLINVRKKIDFIVNNSALNRSLDGIRITFSHGRLVFGIPQLIASHLPLFENKTVVYLIDEAENLTTDQQKFLNTLIRYRKGNATIRVGARLYGIRTYETLGSGEVNKVDAEFQQVVLDNFLREQKDEYEKLVRGLIATRLRRSNRGLNQPSDLDRYFARLDHDEHWKSATLDLARAFDKSDKERPYFKKLRGFIDVTFKGQSDLADEIISLLRTTDYPLIEKTSVFMLYKQWSPRREYLLKTAQIIATEASEYLNGKRGTAYSQTLDHFRSDFLAQLHRDFRRRVPFAGIKTLIELSQGIPRNFLTILKYTYRRSYFANEKPFADGVISVASQSNGVRDSSAWFWEDAQPDGDGDEVREAVEALALLFRSIRFSDRPAECDLCTFSVDMEDLTLTSRQVLRLAENWSYLIQTRDGARNKNDRGVSAKFQLGPMLAPKWDLSEHRRGNIELRPDLANAIFDRLHRANLPTLIRARISGMNGPAFSTTGSDSTTGSLI
jgi:hypothetical protein